VADSINKRLTALYQAYREPVLRFFGGRLRSREQAEELTQDAFIKLMGLLEKSEVKNPRAALFTIANNLLIDTYRGQQVRKDVMAEWHMDDNEGTTSPYPVESRLDNQTSLNWLCEAIVVLPDRCREAFILRKFDGLSYKEIAVAMNLSVKTVEKHLARALLECKKYLHNKEHNVYSLETVRKNKRGFKSEVHHLTR